MPHTHLLRQYTLDVSDEELVVLCRALHDFTPGEHDHSNYKTIAKALLDRLSEEAECVQQTHTKEAT